MIYQIGAVVYGDGRRQYLVFNGMMDSALRPLFETKAATQAWLAAGMPHVPAPNNAQIDALPVTVLAEADDALSPMLSVSAFSSYANKDARWLTGACSFMEMVYANGATANREE